LREMALSDRVVALHCDQGHVVGAARGLADQEGESETGVGEGRRRWQHWSRPEAGRIPREPSPPCAAQRSRVAAPATERRGHVRCRVRCPSLHATAQYSHRGTLRQGAGGVRSKEAWADAGSVSPRALSLWRPGKLGFGGGELSPFHVPLLLCTVQCEAHPRR
jgi:hypothetical protein